MSDTDNIKNKIFVEISESTFMYFQDVFKNFSFKSLKLEIYQNTNFKILYAYSYDGINYSEFLETPEIPNDEFDKYICIWFKRNITNDLGIANKLYEKAPTNDKYFGHGAKMQNVDSKQSLLIIKSISYNGNEISISDVKFKETFDLINEFPRWNLYDNQQVNINRWLEQCNAMAEMYGHTVIYFKTEPVNINTEAQSGIHGIHHTLQNNVIRNVTAIKKLHILAPNNELPQDRVIYSDWDMPLQDDFMIHIVRQKFEQAFGLKAIPNDKDYIYFPIINKLFRVSTMQPKNGLMGVVGWYEVFLAKYEEDSCVRITKDLKDSVSGVDELLGFDSQYGSIVDDKFVEVPEELEKQFESFIDDTLYTEEKIIQSSVEEKKQATENYTNKLEDTTLYVSLKETEKIRELYDKRLEIVSVNPDESLFPISMYNCSKIDKRTVALRYGLIDYSVNNKFSNTINNTYTLKFDIALIGRFNGEIFDIITSDNVLSTIACKKNQIHIFDTSTQTDVVINQKLEQNTIYQIQINFDYQKKIYAFKVFTSQDKQISLIYQNIYKLESLLSNDKIIPVKINNLNLFGGNFIVGNIQFWIDKQKFIDDKCEPLLNQFRW